MVKYRLTEILAKQDIKYLVVHCSDTEQNWVTSDIHQLHLKFGWDGIGYHKIIESRGKIVNGRPEYWVGAHVKGYNNKSLGVCLIGKSEFNLFQMNSLKKVLIEWKSLYPKAQILGHRDVVKTHKTCPNFDVNEWCKKNKL